MSNRTELNPDEVNRVSGGSYVNVSMTIGEIIQTDRTLAGMLAKAGISTTGNKAVQGMSLYEVAQNCGIDAYALEDKMNDYLSSK